jgi:hypothetical protein
LDSTLQILNEKRALVAEGRRLFPSKHPLDYLSGSKKSFDELNNVSSNYNDLLNECKDIVNSNN